MATWTYDEALRELLESEGGYSNHPSDPGGPTNFGITIFDYRLYVNPNGTAADVKAMSADTAKAIYRAKYWHKMRCDELPAGLDYSVFDFGVNSGVSRSAKYLQALVGVDQDGIIGDKTLAAVKGHNAAVLIARLNDNRLAFLKALKTWPVFGKGWNTRVVKVKAISLRMAADAHTVPTPPLVVVPPPVVVPPVVVPIPPTPAPPPPPVPGPVTPTPPAPTEPGWFMRLLEALFFRKTP